VRRRACSHGALSPCPENRSAPTERGGYSIVARHYTRFVSASALFATILISFAVSSFAEGRTTRLNDKAFAFAQELIAHGHIVIDKKNEWGDHHPTSQQENDFIRDHGLAEYANWHLGIDPTHAQNSKARFKFPFGDFKNIHRCALLAVKSRAHQYGYSDIEHVAERLLKMMDSKQQHNSERRPRKFSCPVEAAIGSQASSLTRPTCF
jgi:hypothetical protein